MNYSPRDIAAMLKGRLTFNDAIEAQRTAWPKQRSERTNQKHPREPAFRNASGVS
jgi:hypothetical protein